MTLGEIAWFPALQRKLVPSSGERVPTDGEETAP